MFEAEEIMPLTFLAAEGTSGTSLLPGRSRSHTQRSMRLTASFPYVQMGLPALAFFLHVCIFCLAQLSEAGQQAKKSGFTFLHFYFSDGFACNCSSSDLTFAWIPNKTKVKVTQRPMGAVSCE